MACTQHSHRSPTSLEDARGCHVSMSIATTRFSTHQTFKSIVCRPNRHPKTSTLLISDHMEIGPPYLRQNPFHCLTFRGGDGTVERNNVLLSLAWLDDRTRPTATEKRNHDAQCREIQVSQCQTRHSGIATNCPLLSLPAPTDSETRRSRWMQPQPPV